ncbi:hypothetical protein AAFF_G00384240 [Aldrovandia affinis]|uniref:ribonuclease H n=1 Tax=Aldrovandia affinis TaxID=143900 RepID=A0AAD7WLW0_9TELE|nr:hypothetical protein AAFF_G00384240 [Aldrovandia affinis]
MTPSTTWFSALALHSGYWQVPLSPLARPKTAFTIGTGLWEFNVMLFGLCNSPATFERLKEKVLQAVSASACVVYLDDILVHSSTYTAALNNLHTVIKQIAKANLRLNPANCSLFHWQTSFLGHFVSEKGVSTDQVKRRASRILGSLETRELWNSSFLSSHHLCYEPEKIMQHNRGSILQFTNRFTTRHSCKPCTDSDLYIWMDNPIQ